MTTVAIAHDARVEHAIAAALGHLDVEPIIRGRIVALHPNDTWASAGDKTAVTQPDTLRAVVRHLKHFGPKRMIVTGGSGAGETDEIFRLVGLMEAVEAEGAEF